MTKTAKAPKPYVVYYVIEDGSVQRMPIRSATSAEDAKRQAGPWDRCRASFLRAEPARMVDAPLFWN